MAGALAHVWTWLSDAAGESPATTLGPTFRIGPDEAKVRQSDPLRLAQQPALHPLSRRRVGQPQHDDLALFEFLILEGAQAGLSWDTVLQKRENYRAAFDGFNPQRIARYDRRKQGSLLRNPGIIRNRLKIASAVKNAKAFLSCPEGVGFL